MNKEEKLRQADIAFEEYKIEKKRIIDEDLKLPGIGKAKLYFPITKLMLGATMLAGHEHIEYLNEKNVVTPKGRPVIYVCTHKFKPDIERISFSLNKPSVMMASDFRNSYKTISGWYFNTRPTIFVDPYSKEDRSYTYKMMVRYLKEGHNCMIFPEAVWNLSQNKIVLDIFSGTVRAALESNAVIVCTAIERYGKTFVINRNGYLDFQSVLNRITDLSFEAICHNPRYAKLRKAIVNDFNAALRETMATLTYEIWEDYKIKYGVTSRASLPDDYYDQFIKSLTSEWPGYKLSDNAEQQVQNKKEIEQVEVEESIEGLRKNLSINNLFLFTSYDRYNKAKELVETYKSDDFSKIKRMKR